MTKRRAPASISQNVSGHQSIELPVPMTRTIGGSAGSPKDSAHSETPFASMVRSATLGPPSRDHFRPVQTIVLYDAECGLCKWLLAGLLRWDSEGRLRPIALQRPEADELLADLAPDDRMASWHLISPGGKRHTAGAAVPSLLMLLPGGRLPAVAFARFPNLTEPGYRWVADH